MLIFAVIGYGKDNGAARNIESEQKQTGLFSSTSNGFWQLVGVDGPDPYADVGRPLLALQPLSCETISANSNDV